MRRIAARPGAIRVLIGLALLASAPAADRKLSGADAELARKFSSVQAWEGIWEVTVNGTSTRNSEHEILDSRHDSTAYGTFRLERPEDDGASWNPQGGYFRWDGKGVMHGQGRGVYSRWDPIFGTGSEWEQDFGGSVRHDRITFSVSVAKQSMNLHPGAQEDADRPMLRRRGREVHLNRNSGRDELETGPIDESNPVLLDTWTLGLDEAGSKRDWAVVANGPGVLNFFVEHDGVGRDQYFRNKEGPVKRSRVLLFPVYDNLEVKVTIDGYAEWRPLGSTSDPKKPGNNLVARATLRHKDGAPADDLPKVKEFRFQLLDVSREPGVCLNWPLDATDRNPDLRLATAGTGGELKDEDQKLTVPDPPKDDKAQPYAEAQVDSFDFGGRAELRIICELEDGRELVGLMQNDGGEDDLVRLPKMNGPGWIAAKWRADHKAERLPDSDDEEKVEGQPYNGDGFTLYEEYRGWIEKGKHIEGDPLKKDFFIYNGRGADFRGGIALFSRLSKLRVHSQLRLDTEIGMSDRRMNANHRAAPHRVDQHGVILMKENGWPGGSTVGVDGADAKKAFRPKFVDRIYLEWSEAGRGGSAFSVESGLDKYKLSARDAELAWDRGVAHELLHAVGVDHHGERPMRTEKFTFEGASAPLNPTGRPRYVHNVANMWAEWYATHLDDALVMNTGPTLTVKWEDTERDLFEEQMAAYEKTLATYRASQQSPSSQQYWDGVIPKLARFGKSKEFWMLHDDESAAADRLYVALHVGARNGTDSGNDSCVMKYYFSEAYEVAGRPNTFYVIRPGTNRAGRELCRSPAGTGNNAASRGPKDRFGDAKPGRGDCFGQICPNDAIPPRSVEGGY